MTNKKLGNTFERELCNILSEHGYWAYNCPQTNAGQQPADIIASRNRQAYLIDCKVCSGRAFDKSRIEDNQWNSMTLWSGAGNSTGWFAVKFACEIYMIELWKLDMEKRVSLNQEWFKQNAMTLEEWLVNNE